MGGIDRRLSKLEDAAGGVCRTCAEKPIIVVWGEEDEAPAPCPECGRLPEEIDWTT